jgi:hypothetical protein
MSRFSNTHWHFTSGGADMHAPPNLLAPLKSLERAHPKTEDTRGGHERHLPVVQPLCEVDLGFAPCMINGKPEIAGFSQIIEEKNALELEQ